MSTLRVATRGVYRASRGLDVLVRRAEAGLAACWKARVVVAKPRESRGRGAAARNAGVEALMVAIFKQARRWITSEDAEVGSSHLVPREH